MKDNVSYPRNIIGMKNVEATTSALVLDKICKTSCQAPCWKIKMASNINIAVRNKGSNADRHSNEKIAGKRDVDFDGKEAPKTSLQASNTIGNSMRD